MWTGQAKGITRCIYRSGQKKLAMEDPGMSYEANADTECCSGAVGLSDALPLPAPGSKCMRRSCMYTILSYLETYIQS